MAELTLGAAVDPATHERRDDATVVDTDDLTTHGVIVGMTGSGKTGLGVVLIEEVLRAGIPVLAIDPKGDLTNLALRFPKLDAADFRPWIDEAQARAAGQSPDDFAAAQAAAWKDGLAGWGLDGAAIQQLVDAADVTIYTPGSSAGTPINIVGSLQAPATDDVEVIGDEIDGIVAGLLGLVGIAADPLSSREHILLANLIQHAWTSGQSLDLATLVGQVLTPPIRKLGVFELDEFYPPDDRRGLAMKLNGLLASPAFASWSDGAPLDIASMLYTPDGKARCAVVTISHLSDDERQFITAMLLGKVVTWMRRQSGTTDLRALLYMDEVMGYLPPSANPPSKPPIMTLMKQARAFGLGVVLATQNPVDIDYKAISNAGTWLVGRLQTERDKDRLLDGMTAAAGTVDVAAVGQTISGLAKREFVLRRAGKDQPETITTRWAMSYLRGPMTRDQISQVSGPSPTAGATPATASTATSEPPSSPTPSTPSTPAEAAPADGAAAAPNDPAAGAATTTTATGAPSPAAPSPAASAPAATTPTLGADETSVSPTVADGIPVRWVDPAAPWLATVGGSGTGTRHEAAIVGRVALRYDDTKSGVDTDQEYEAVIFPLGAQIDATRAVAVDYDDRDLRTEAPAGAVYRLTDAPLGEAATLKRVERALVDHLVASQRLEIFVNKALKLYSRPGEASDEFETRCLQAANDAADAETAKLRGKYEGKVATLQQRRADASDRAEVAEQEHESRRNAGLLSTAGSVLGDLFSGRRSRGSLIGKLGRAAGSAARSGGGARRVEAAQDKVERIDEQMEALELELGSEITDIDTKWMATGKEIETTTIPLERTDVKVTQLVVAWVPVD